MGVAPRMPSGSTVYKVAEGLSFGPAITISLAEILPGYASYTSDNFIVVLRSGRSMNYGEITGRIVWAGYSYPAISYDSDTGQLKLTGYGPSIMYSGGVYIDGSSVVDVYAVKRVRNVSV